MKNTNAYTYNTRYQHIPTEIKDMNASSYASQPFNISMATTDSITEENMKTQATLIHDLSSKAYPAFKDTPFQFALTERPANHNSKILEKHNFSMNNALSAPSKDTQLDYGSEFRPVEGL